MGGACTIFFFARLSSFHEKYKTALCFTGLVTLIACYHYFRIFNSFVDSYEMKTCDDYADWPKGNFNCGYRASGEYFNDAYRYMDWLLTVPLLLIEIVLVMQLPADETFKQSAKLGASSALMILLGSCHDSFRLYCIHTCDWTCEHRGQGRTGRCGAFMQAGVLVDRGFMVYVPGSLHPADADGNNQWRDERWQHDRYSDWLLDL